MPHAHSFASVHPGRARSRMQEPGNPAHDSALALEGHHAKGRRLIYFLIRFKAEYIPRIERIMALIISRIEKRLLTYACLSAVHFSLSKPSFIRPILLHSDATNPKSDQNSVDLIWSSRKPKRWLNIVLVVYERSL